MLDDALAALSLTELAAAIASKEVSSLEATRNCVARLERHGPALNSVAALDAEAALEAARAADAELAAGRVRGPLHGVPLAHKDMYYRAGRPSACGSKILADFVPEVTATALTRLDRAGALDIARLNMVEFALGTTGHNEITGAVRNPWNPPAVRRAVPAPRWRRAWSTARWAPTPAPRSACRRRPAAWSGSRRPSAGSAASAPCRCRSASTPWGRSRARWRTRR
jgi:Asp-tRNA(Asn)/Glu-tRNA(Gln) amidotransferase A subunit family amidase